MAAMGECENNSNVVEQVQNVLSEFISSEYFVDQNVVQESGELDKELFLQALRDYTCLWDTSDTNYKNRTMKLNAWKSLSQMFRQEGK